MEGEGSERDRARQWLRGRPLDDTNAGDPASGGPVDYPRFSDAERDRRWQLVRSLMRRESTGMH